MTLLSICRNLNVIVFYMQYWDLRTPNPVSTVTLPERCYAMDVVYPLLVVGTAERHVQIFNLTNPGTVFRVSKHCTTALPANLNQM